MKKRITIDKIAITGQYRLQITENGNFAGKRTFNKRKDAEAYKKKLMRKK